jgi:hypothetical protein
MITSYVAIKVIEYWEDEWVNVLVFFSVMLLNYKAII